ncbi:nduf-5 [Pristionchus pacificus]|uniref:Complex I-15 kDa n=1 Tax=Pristionchus pacificus TaxID=54126 RepID=A0A454XW24_PRIPA|nr:nduf-5 [Pristionchus pacificus]|eukprot:PDM75787.1 nduf-5 [Pristionchus pacificus]
MATGNVMPDRYQSLTPILKTPLSDTLALPLSQQGRLCGFFEAQFYKCMEAYGAKLGRKYCDFENRDFNECVTGDKQKMRSEAIRAQRIKLYKEGKLETAFEENHPAPGEFKPDHFQWNRTH